MSKIKQDSAARKSAFLGMPHGTAANRLRKMILFHLLEKRGENICFNCAKRINTAAELSIEHKQPWEGVSLELYWSMDNIALFRISAVSFHIATQVDRLGDEKLGRMERHGAGSANCFAP